MKSKILIPLLTLSLIIAVQPIFAEESTTLTPKPTKNPVREEIRQEKQEARTTITQVRQENREEKKSQLSELKQKQIQKLYDAIKNGLVKRHEALLKIKDKLQARIDKNPMNKDTTQAKVELAKFTAADKIYTDDLAALDKKFNELKNSAKPNEIVQGLKDSVKLVREDLNAIKKVLTNTVTTLAKAPKLETTKTQ